MAKDTDVVNPEPTIEEQPTPQIEGAPAGQPLDPASSSEVTLESFRDMVREEMQSVKDTRIGKSETRLDNLESAIAQYEAEKGGTVDVPALSKLQGVQREKELLERLEALEGGNAVAPSAGAGEQLLTEKQASILSGVGLTASDPRFTQFLRDNPKFKTSEEYFEALDKQAIAWQTDDAKKPQPSSSTIAQTVPSVVPASGELDKFSNEQLEAKINELSKQPSKNLKVITQLATELKERDGKQ